MEPGCRPYVCSVRARRIVYGFVADDFGRACIDVDEEGGGIRVQSTHSAHHRGPLASSEAA